MNFELFKEISKGFYDLNRVPLFVTQQGKIIFHTMADEMISSEAEDFLATLELNSVNVFGNIEYYTVFNYNDNDQQYSVHVGPVFSAHPITIGYSDKLAIEKIITRDYLKDIMLSLTLTGEENFLKYSALVGKMTGNGEWNYNIVQRKNLSLKSTLDKNLTEYIFETRENLLSPYAPETEKRILEMVKAGDVDGVKKINVVLTVNAPGQSVSYLFKIVSLVAICTRAVVDSGVDATAAYGLSDLYLSKLGGAVNNKQISDIANSILPHFTSLVLQRQGKIAAKYSPHLIKAEKYIKVHLHYKLTLDEVAKEVGISEKYLSRLFITHKGEKFTTYVNRCRVDEAKELMLNTDHSLTEISYSLGFVSESYFIKIFGELIGMTPNAYRRQYKNNK